MTPTTLLTAQPQRAAVHRTVTPVAPADDHRTTFVGIVLAGSYHAVDTAFSGLLPRPLVPVAQVPLVAYALQWLTASRVSAVKVCTSGQSRSLDFRSILGTRLATSLDFVEDGSPRGPAGSAHDAALGSEADTFVVVEGSVIPVLKLQAVLDEHQRRNAALTVVVHEQPLGRTAGARVSTPAGIYVFSRRAFDAVAKTGFQDIKEHLIPTLRRRGERVVAYVTPDFCPRVLNAETYLAVNHWIIEQLPSNPDLLISAEPFRTSGDVVAHPTADVHPTARIVGPVMLGPDVTIGAGATIVGPTSIGARTVIRDGAVVCRSVIWGDCEIGTGAFVDHAVVADLVKIPAQSAVHRAVRMPAPAGWRPGPRRGVRSQPIRPTAAGPVADLALP